MVRNTSPCVYTVLVCWTRCDSIYGEVEIYMIKYLKVVLNGPYWRITYWNAFGTLLEFVKDLCRPKDIAWNVPPISSKLDVFIVITMLLLALNFYWCILALVIPSLTDRSIEFRLAMVILNTGNMYLSFLSCVANFNNPLYNRCTWTLYAGEAIQIYDPNVSEPFAMAKDIKQWLTENIADGDWTVKDTSQWFAAIDLDDSLLVEWLFECADMIFVFKRKADAIRFKLTFGGQRYDHNRKQVA